MGYANAQRTLDYIRFVTEFISQPECAPSSALRVRERSLISTVSLRPIVLISFGCTHASRSATAY